VFFIQYVTATKTYTISGEWDRHSLYNVLLAV